MSLAFEPKEGTARIARSAAIHTVSMEQRTVIVQFRVRNVIREVNRSKELIAEEMYLWGFAGSGDNRKILDYGECKRLLIEARSKVNIPHDRQKQIFEDLSMLYGEMKNEVQQLAEQRAKHLVEAHSRFKELVGGRRYEAVFPVLPPDVMGIYVLLPKPKTL
jgi:hypothetical protein